jgi:hypothetical protein
MTTEREPPIPLGTLAWQAALVAVVSCVANACVWMIGQSAGGMKIGVGEVVAGSVIGVVGAFVVFAVLAKFAARPRRIFTRIAIAVLVLYALGPISAVIAPYREGAARFNLATVLATEVMHVISGLAVIWLFTRRSLPDARA